MATQLKHAPKEGLLHPRWLLAVRGLIAIAFLVGSYLLFISFRGMSAVGCGPESGCDKVLHSRWAYWFGLPVSLFALAAYAAIFVTTFRLGRNVEPARQRQAWKILVPGAVLVIGAAIWFFVLQVAVIKAICPFCMTAHGCGFLASLLILLAAPYGPVPEKPWQREKQVFLPAALAQKLFGAAFIGIAVLVAGQTLHQKKTFVVTSIPELPAGGVSSNAPATNPQPLVAANATPPGPTNLQKSPVPVVPSPTNRIAQAPSNAPGPAVPPQPAPSGPVPPNPYAGRAFILYGTNVLDLKRVPLIGSAQAPYMIVSLYDYTCSHCKLMHGPLLQAQRAFSNQLGVISLPMPLDPACNHTVKQTFGMHTNACQYARLGLAVWRANPAKLQEFDDWMFASDVPPFLEAAYQHASQLVGTAGLDRAMRDPWIEQQIQQDVGIYDFAYKAGQGSMPQIIIGRRVAVGTMKVQDLFRLIEEQFGLKRPGGS